MPSTTGGVYHSHRMTRLTGQGIRGALLAEAKKPTLSLGQKEALIAEKRLSGKGTEYVGLGRHLSGKGATEYVIAESLGRRLLGKGNGSFLLDGGMGGQSSYPSVSAYTQATGRVIRKGGGLEQLSSKLSNLNIKPKKHNIKFEM